VEFEGAFKGGCNEILYMKGVCSFKSNNSNRFHVLEHFCGEESEGSEELEDVFYQAASHVYFGDFLAIAKT
jgi:hypothetical protein